MKRTEKIIRAVLFLLLVSITTVALAQPEWLDIIGSSMLVGGFAVKALVLVADIDEVSNEIRAPKQIGDRLWYVARDQVDLTVAFPAPNPNTREIGSIPLKAGEFWHYIDIISDSANPKNTSSDTDFAIENTQTNEFYVGGNEADLLNLIQSGQGSKFLLVYEECESGKKWLLGGSCKWMELTEYESFSQESLTGWRLLFSRTSAKLPYVYVGTLPTQSPTVIAADATTEPLTSAVQYQFSANTVPTVFTGLSGATSADVGRVIDLLGAPTATNATTIPTANDFILNQGATWTANPGSRISVEVFEDGVGTFKFIEVAGTRVQT